MAISKDLFLLHRKKHSHPKVEITQEIIMMLLNKDTQEHATFYNNLYDDISLHILIDIVI